MSAPSGHSGSGAIIAALGANLGIAVLKFFGFCADSFVVDAGGGYSLGG